MTDNEVARKDEVLAALTRILRREATESAIVTTRERVPTLCADGKVRYSERTDTRVVEIPPKTLRMRMKSMTPFSGLSFLPLCMTISSIQSGRR